jgi:hypothetical protein
MINILTDNKTNNITLTIIINYYLKQYTTSK